MSQSPVNPKQVEKAIEKGVKKVIAESEINPSTRKGNKELNYLIKRLSEQPFSSVSAATQFGEALGRRIVALSQQMNRSHLDQGVIQQLVLRKQVPDLAEVPIATTPPGKSAPQAKPTIASPSPVEALSPEPEPLDAAMEDEDPSEEAESVAAAEALVAVHASAVAEAAEFQAVALDEEEETEENAEDDDDKEDNGEHAEIEAVPEDGSAEVIPTAPLVEEDFAVAEDEAEAENDDIDEKNMVVNESSTELEDEEDENEDVLTIEALDDEQDEEILEIESLDEDEEEILEADALASSVDDEDAAANNKETNEEGAGKKMMVSASPNGVVTADVDVESEAEPETEVEVEKI